MIIHQISENFSPTKHQKWGVSNNEVRLGLWSGYCKTINSSLKGWGAIAKLLPLVDLFLLSTNEKALFFTVLSELSVAYFMDKNYLKPIFLSTAMDS